MQQKSQEERFVEFLLQEYGREDEFEIDPTGHDMDKLIAAFAKCGRAVRHGSQPGIITITRLPF